MKRLHVHVSVTDLTQSIQFYSTMFSAAPSVLKDDYAKWMLEDPRVNFAISQRGAKAGLNHLGMQVESADELQEMNLRLQNVQGPVVEQSGAACCYAKSDKYWVTDPEGIAWETFHTLDSIPVFGADTALPTSEPACAAASTANARAAVLATGKAASACCAPASNAAPATTSGKGSCC